MDTEPQNNAPMWAIMELMGHVKTGALISKDTQFGTAMLRADVPMKDGSMVTQLVNPASIYRLTFVSEEIARACAESNNAMPLQSWDLQKLIPVPKLPPGKNAEDDDWKDDRGVEDEGLF